MFFSHADRVVYLDWLGQYCARYGVQILAYCLMGNHVHLVAVPAGKKAFEQVFRPLHHRYARRANRPHGWRGALWQGRYFSSTLDEPHLWAAIRYVEQNPVRAGMVPRAEAYRWSSAPAHCGLRADPVLTANPDWGWIKDTVRDWAGWLSQVESPALVKALREATRGGRPCGSDKFVDELERRSGMVLRRRPRGRPRKK